MSISASHIRLLVDGGMDAEGLIIVASAMERGDDYRAVAKLVDDLRAVECPPEAAAIAVMELATQILRENANAQARHLAPRDEHTAARDSNRSRRNMPDGAWRALRKVIFERDGFECQYCGATDDLTCDHIVPLARGGSNDNDNLATACRSCNSSKGDKLVNEWRRQWA